MHDRRTQARILVVEDDSNIAGLVSEALGAQFDVAVAGDARTALACLASRPADLVLLDWMVPGGSAETLLRAEEAGIPTIVMTGHPYVAMQMREKGLPCLVKPFSFDALFRTIGERLATHTASQQLRE